MEDQQFLDIVNARPLEDRKRLYVYLSGGVLHNMTVADILSAPMARFSIIRHGIGDYKSYHRDYICLECRKSEEDPAKINRLFLASAISIIEARQRTMPRYWIFVTPRFATVCEILSSSPSEINDFFIALAAGEVL